jgi:carbonic anhydrase/acetyltransferase-like protein (isoleucine patch superfamily)
MDIRALLLVNSDGLNGEFSGLPAALIDVAGKSALQRIAERLVQFGAAEVKAVIEGPVTFAPRGNGTAPKSITTSRERFWRVAENTFGELVQDGAELVLLFRLGAYAEIDIEKLVQFHLDERCRVSQVSYQAKDLEIFCISASRRNDAASLFRSQLTKCRSDCPLVEHTGYLNPLAGPSDLRQFAIDILMLKTETEPAGKQVRPGVWVAPGAQIEKGARLLAPAFVGSFAKLRAGAVITRCTSVEHHSQIDCGTVVENSSILAYSYVGAGLDLAHCVVGAGQLASLRRNTVVEITDGKLIAHLAATSGRKLLGSATEFLTYLPKQVWQGMFGARGRLEPDLNTALRQASPSLGTASGYQAPACDTEAADKFSASLAVARRYGNQ